MEYAKLCKSMHLSNARYSATERRQFADRPPMGAFAVKERVLS
jgi:hypothetical protein